MRFYSAGNMYLSSIQQGIQAAHCVGEMALRIVGNKYVSEWLTNHKTLICVNGGNNAALHEFLALANNEKNPGYPVAHFHEDQDSMAGMLTCVGIIVPAKIYEADLTELVVQHPSWHLGN